ncbi:MAG: hypothetical protein CMI63_03910 [Parvularcula sp.]|nr:hypothetical protein [Parvularcula sp.]
MSAYNSDIVTSDLSRFGYRELKMAAELLAAYCDNPPNFLSDGLTVMLNMHSGYVFLSDEDFNVGMMNGKTLEQYHSCPECGSEGFAEELNESDCCRAYIADFLKD